MPKETLVESDGQEMEEAALVQEARSRCSCIGWRLREELHLFFVQWKAFALAGFVLLYLTTVVFLNLAFYRYAERYADIATAPRLQDAGYDLIPPISKDVKAFVDMPMNTLGLVFMGVLVGVFRPKALAESSSPYLVNVVKRLILCLAQGHMLRAATYLSTTLPGSADHCLIGDELRPPTLMECFYKPASLYTNCGDLVFSGHMFIVVLVVCAIYQYSARMWSLSSMGHSVLTCTAVLLALLQACSIIAARNHYTVDVVVAVYLAPMVWGLYDKFLEAERAPDQKAIALWVLGRDGAQRTAMPPV